jgi:UDP-N-acetylmuramyl tripeptide synthase
MTEAIDPEVAIITNVAMDHIGLVNSMDEVFDETSGAVKALKKGFAVLNSEDSLVLEMRDLLTPNINSFLFGNNHDNNSGVYFSKGINGNKSGIYYKDELIIELELLPFKSKHFIQNTLAAVSACICLGISLNDIKTGVSSYKSLKRRFSIIHNNPCIIDDFAHNPDGIKATIKSTASSTKGNLWVVCSIRGSRGSEINQMNAQALAEALKELKQINYTLIITNSSEVVDHLNIVEDYEQKIFQDTLEQFKINYNFQENLLNSLKHVLELCAEEDTILLIGAQGMDPAADLITDIID